MEGPSEPRAPGWVPALMLAFFLGGLAFYLFAVYDDSFLVGGTRRGSLFQVAVCALTGFGVFVLMLGYVLPRPRRLLGPRRRLWFVVQAVLAFLPFILFGRPWNGLASMAAGAALLAFSAPWSWLLFAAVAGTRLVIGLALHASVDENVQRVVATVGTGISIYGLCRLVDQVHSLQVVRTQIAKVAVDRERSQLSRRLRVELGAVLTAVAGTAQQARDLLPARPEAAAAAAREAVRICRDGLAKARSWAGGGPAEVAAPRSAGTGDVAREVAAAVVLGYLAIQTVAALWTEYRTGPGPGAMVVAALAFGALALVQARHSLGWRNPRGRTLTLTAQALLTFPFYLAFPHVWAGAAGFLAGSLLLLVPPRSGWALAALTLGAEAVLIWTQTGSGIGTVLTALNSATTALPVYGLARLAQVAHDLHAARAELARVRVAKERLRISRDLHDLLGLGLSSIALKGELAGRLLPADPDRAAEQLDDIVLLARRSLEEIEAVLSGEPRVSLGAELDLATAALRDAGIRLDLAVRPEEVPAELEAVLGAVVREALTNVLRHSDATGCAITVDGSDGVLRLTVRNDRAAAADPGGTGLTSLTDRVAAQGGGLVAGPDGIGGYLLEVSFPVLRASPSRSRYAPRPPGSGRPAWSSPT